MLKISDIGILADDLTGACDVAGVFAKAVGPVPVYVKPEALPEAEKGLAVVNTQSRLMSAKVSKILIKSVGLNLVKKPVIFKKIDTGLRGSVGAELEGLIDAIGSCKVILAPAFPRIGKTTRCGIQYDEGIPIDKTEYANDPISPVHSANIIELIKETGDVKCQVCDAETNEDLRRIVNDSMDGSKIVFVGSLGLAGALAEQIERTGRNQIDIKASLQPIIVCGSRYSRAQAQIREAVSQLGAKVIDIHPMNELNAGYIRTESKAPLIVCIVPQTLESSLSPAQEIITHFTTKVAALITKLKPDGLGIVGGDTAFHLLKQFQVNCLKVHGSIADVIAYGTIADGTLAGYPFATKGGAVGQDNALVQMADYLRGKRR